MSRMTAPTTNHHAPDNGAFSYPEETMARLEEIEARLAAAKSHASPVITIPTSDIEYLLQEIHMLTKEQA